MAEDKSEQLKQALSDKEVSGLSPAVLQHQGIKLLATSDEDSMGDLTPEQVTAFAILRAYNEIVPIPKSMSFIKNYISLSRATDRKGRLEYAGCYKSYPGYVVAGGSQGLPGIPEQKKPGLISSLMKRRPKNEEQQ